MSSNRFVTVTLMVYLVLGCVLMIFPHKDLTDGQAIAIGVSGLPVSLLIIYVTNKLEDMEKERKEKKLKL